MLTHEQIRDRFRAHELQTQAALSIDALRKLYEATARAVSNMTPESREQSLAMTQLEQSAFWAVAAISRNQPQPDSQLTLPRVDEQDPVR